MLSGYKQIPNGLFFVYYLPVTFVSVFCFIFINHQCLGPFYMFDQQLKNLNILKCFELKYFWVFRR